MLEAKSQTVGGKGRQTADRAPLTGRLFDETGDRLTPTHTKKDGRRIRYFVSNRLLDRSSTTAPDRSGWRLPAAQLEEAVASVISGALKSAKPSHSSDAGKIKRVMETLAHLTSGEESRPDILDLIARVCVTPGTLEIELERNKLASILEMPSKEVPVEVASISAPFQLRRRGVETKLVYGYEPPKVDTVLLRRVARGYAWWEEIRTGRATMQEIVKREKLSRRFVAVHLDLAFMAPDIVATIVEGRQARSLCAQALRSRQLPVAWSSQRDIVEGCC